MADQTVSSIDDMPVDARRAESNTGASRSLFYPVYGTILLLVLFVGFSRTFFLIPVFSPPPEHPLAYAHGVTLTAWFALFIVQSLLAANGRPEIHRRLGRIAIVVVFASVVVFIAMAINLFSGRPPSGVEAELVDRARVVRLVQELTVFAAFPTLVAIAAWFRNRPQIHGRLMLLATVSLMGPAISRILLWPAFSEIPRVPVTIGSMIALVFTPLVYEWLRSGRVHPAMAWGAPLYYLWLVGSGLVVPMLLI